MSTAPTPLFDMSKAQPIQAAQTPLFDMSKATPIQQSQPDITRGAAQATKLSPAPKPFTKDWFKGIFYNQIADPGTAALPAAGAMAGGIAGGAASGGFGAVGGAGIGGMGGEAAKQLIRRKLGFGDAPTTPEDAAKRIIMQGGVQGGIQGVTEGLPFLAGSLQRAATSQYQRALSPTTKINKAITQKITPELINRSEYGSLGGLEERAGQQAANLRPQLETAYQAMPQTPIAGSGTQTVQALENLKGKYTVQGMPANPTAVDAISGVQNVVKQYGNDIAPDSLRKLKQIFDDPVAARGGYAGADLASAYTLKAQKTAANQIRSILGQASPDVAALNKEISFWLDVQRVTSQSGLRRIGQEGGLVRTLALPFLTGAGAGAVAGHVGEGTAAGALGSLVAMAVRSPMWRTTSAVAKSQVANALARGSVGETTALLARFGLVAADQASHASSSSGSSNALPEGQQ